MCYILDYTGIQRHHKLVIGGYRKTLNVVILVTLAFTNCEKLFRIGNLNYVLFATEGAFMLNWPEQSESLKDTSMMVSTWSGLTMSSKLSLLPVKLRHSNKKLPIQRTLSDV